MAAEDEGAPQPPVGPQFPAPTLPAVFIDGVASLLYNQQVVKFYLSRLDPSLTGQGAPKMTEVAQVVMPLSGFVMTAIFFEDMLGRMVEAGLVQQKDVDQLREQAKQRTMNDVG